jgi:hypothetical protein
MTDPHAVRPAAGRAIIATYPTRIHAEASSTRP